MCSHFLSLFLFFAHSFLSFCSCVNTLVFWIWSSSISHPVVNCISMCVYALFFGCLSRHSASQCSFPVCESIWNCLNSSVCICLCACVSLARKQNTAGSRCKQSHYANIIIVCVFIKSGNCTIAQWMGLWQQLILDIQALVLISIKFHSVEEYLCKR